MKVVILGGSGFIGQNLTQFLIDHGHEVNAYGREAFSEEFDLSAAIDGQDVLIMLAGENIAKRWNEKYKKALWDSRIETTKKLKHAIDKATNPPQRILAASAVGIYPQTACTERLDEFSDTEHQGFLAELAQAWERQSRMLAEDVVIFRFGVVLGNGGALAKMLPAFKLGLGGPVAGGQQCFSWVHIKDLCRAFGFAIGHSQLQGVYNLTSPNPVTNREFGQSMAKQLHRPFWLPLPLWQLQLMFGEGAQVLVHSSAVYPRKLLDAGFEFDYAEVDQALAEILS